MTYPSHGPAQREQAIQERLEEILNRLDAISEDLGEMAYGALKEAVYRGTSARTDVDKKLAKARRSVDSAVHVLESLLGEQGTGEE